MLTLHGIPRNITELLLGKVSFSPVEKERKSTSIIVDSNLSKRELEGYVALISSHPDMTNEIEAHIPIVYNVKFTNSLSEGDVVEILPNGVINVLYQISSKHNIIFVTSKCDCNCVMCPQPVEKNEGNLTELNLKLISLISQSTEELALTGGEPTLSGQDLFKLILACGNFLPKTSLILLTNGKKFSDFEYTHFFSSLRHPNITIGIPLYGDNSFEHDVIMGSKGAFNETVMGIINLASFGNQIEIRTVVHNLTYNKLLRISDFIYRNMTFVRHIAFMGLEVIDRARKNIGSLWVEPDKFVPYLGESIHYLIQRGMKVSIYNIPLCLLPDYLWDFAQKSISDWKNLFDTKCIECSVKEKCSGMFDSGIDIYRKYLKPIH